MTRYHCAVVIPTKNAMPGLKPVLQAVLAQEAPWPFEVIVIDSGSRDGTAEYVRGLSGVRLIEIPPESFGHGRTRNLGVEAADAQYVAFLTHDARPADPHWLANLVAAAEQDSGIAGVFGRHIAYDTASPFTRNDLDRHFEGFLAHPLVVHRDLDPQKYENDIGWRQFLHFYSDNNSLLRKSVWEKIPYPDVEFAEDQLWARAVIEAGYAKAYAPEAAVYHSHDYSPLEQLRRAFDESRNFKKYFGYELSPKLFPALATIAHFSVQAFRQKLDETRYGKVSLRQRLDRAGQRAGLVAGHFLGANHQHLPKPLAGRISLDNRLFKA
ncbi:glycosyltransferase family 2 protein [Roseibium litorale]|uniref:Glycosyltransferase n=1 Tax=Roseibium litorale TaxID=2803841 RepID=A0ABR9CW18_9HYPH|nr:glycosyltransferase family 2 protein [Roseibium litorale]MBD8894267.1 glycosyltransferase [Roseibium litorale]